MKLLLENWKSYLDEIVKLQGEEPKAPPPGVKPKRTQKEQEKLQAFLNDLESEMKKDETLLDKVIGLIKNIQGGDK